MSASTFGQTTGPLRPALPGARFRLSPNSSQRESAAKPRAVPRAHRQRKDMIMTNGTVKFYNSHKGFGFIQPDDGGRDVFVHATALERAGISMLQEGQKVSFDTQTDARSGKIAVGRLAVE